MSCTPIVLPCTCSVDSNKLPALTGTRWPTRSLVSTGVATIADSVDTVVMALNQDFIMTTDYEFLNRTCRVESSRLPALTGTRWPTRSLVSAGVATMADSVDTVVMATLSGTSARARNVTTLLATPPGQDATRQILRKQEDVS